MRFRRLPSGWVIEPHQCTFGIVSRIRGRFNVMDTYRKSSEILWQLGEEALEEASLDKGTRWTVRTRCASTKRRQGPCDRRVTRRFRPLNASNRRHGVAFVKPRDGEGKL